MVHSGIPKIFYYVLKNSYMHLGRNFVWQDRILLRKEELSYTSWLWIKKRLFEDIHCISFSSHGITVYITTQKLYKYASPINVNQSHIRKCKKVDSKCLPHFVHTCTTVRKIWNLKCWRWFYSYDKVLFQSEDRHLSN